MRTVEGGVIKDGITKQKRKRMEAALWRLERYHPDSPKIEILRVKLGICVEDHGSELKNDIP